MTGLRLTSRPYVVDGPRTMTPRGEMEASYWPVVQQGCTPTPSPTYMQVSPQELHPVFGAEEGLIPLGHFRRLGSSGFKKKAKTRKSRPNTGEVPRRAIALRRQPFNTRGPTYQSCVKKHAEYSSNADSDEPTWPCTSNHGILEP